MSFGRKNRETDANMNTQIDTQTVVRTGLKMVLRQTDRQIETGRQINSLTG